MQMLPVTGCKGRSDFAETFCLPYGLFDVPKNAFGLDMVADLQCASCCKHTATALV